MPRAAAIDDMFGHVPQKGELSLAEAGPPLSEGVVIGGFLLRRSPTDHETPETVRANLTRLIAFVREAETMPWNARDLRYFTGLVCYMAEWLKGGEGDRLLAEFKAEMDRLGAPADQVAPNWRRIWGIEG
jgi:hypothetical protein